MKNKNLLYIPIVLCILWLIPDLFSVPNTGDWCALLVLEMSLQILYNYYIK